MGASVSSFDSVADARSSISGATTAAPPRSPAVEDTAGHVEMEAMLRGPTPSVQLLGSLVDSEVTDSTAAADVVSVFCLDASKQSLLRLREVLETPVTDRAAAFHRISMNSTGVLLNAPAATSLQTLKSFLLSHTGEGRVGRGDDSCRCSAEPPSSLHVFALKDPTLVVDGVDGPVVVTREMSADLLIPLASSVDLATLGRDPTLLAFTSAEANAAAGASLSCAGRGNGTAAPPSEVAEPTEGDAPAASKSSPSVPATAAAVPRTVVLLYSRDARFGMDGGIMLLIGCCVALCACIAAGVCCCMTSKGKNNQSQQQPGNMNGGKPNYNNNNQQYYGDNNNNQQYNGNGGNYGNPYAPTGYDNNNTNYNPPANGYGVPPNAYGNNTNNPNPYQNQYQQQPQPQPQPNMNNNPGYYNTGVQQPGAAPL
ncbi:hypothetical protein ABB37_05326 [Leptomonas pyrrhocoris]|uniref:Uncharacterized protein n=1 Tax=Leptomonas pyrrhocoris TaxID=157538 RepID=A0A0M9G058_LEPPY|nr:hypothetical protein ABB37_05326 [Leptomonas pyrrhocoris]XP_015657937.1 hypothetical protein ABB37_05326 [Leptomonas pyrrhocoris]XP_015657938.1 hypothetical protein ABB37_05326 [Leptomonas pyrrhocoris]KPA79497.1 hypothetical protein ABB37_05326 [Leptomonas pyrrhocoris]KPA79498.1 hypothetical protein ABB37_05326 [Leptomonas pyrrhocoris]KPA79499.1 hypothetical protein ABB37_05326 [Leptomonas pyrrhocoris]|eukprot:XP_015657936.1 hypothetical protein ABB37_05326 [Leptomonas pyrrhocoris]